MAGGDTAAPAPGRGAARARVVLVLASVMLLVLVILAALVAVATSVLSERAAADSEQGHAPAAADAGQVALHHHDRP